MILSISKVYNTWQPEPLGPNSIEGRQGIEGYYLLAHIDKLKWEEPKPEPLVEKSMASLRKTLKAVWNDQTAFPAGSPNRIAWDQWSHKYILPEVANDPNQNETELYIAHLARRGVAYKSPLNLILFNKNSENNARSWELADASEVIDNEFEYPYVLQAAMNSVRTELQQDPLEPRLTAITDNLLSSHIDTFETKTNTFYKALATTRGGFTVEAIKVMIKRFYSYDACGYAVSGSKAILAETVLRWGMSFVSVFYRGLRAVAQTRLNRLITQPTCTEEEENLVIKEIKFNDITREITQKDANSFLENQTLTNNALAGILDLFRNRDNRICEAHKDVHSGEKHYSILKNSLFIPQSFLVDLLEGTLNEGWVDLYNFSTFSKYHKAFCLFEKEGLFSLIVLNITEKKIFLVDPRLEPTSELPNSAKELLTVILTRLKDVQASMQYEFNDWSALTKAPNMYYENATPEDNGIFHVLAVLYFLVVDVPVYFNRELTGIFRDNFAYWLLMDGQLPI